MNPVMRHPSAAGFFYTEWPGLRGRPWARSVERNWARRRSACLALGVVTDAISPAPHDACRAFLGRDAPAAHPQPRAFAHEL